MKSTDVLTVLGDFNAKIGKGAYQDIIGPYSLGERNSRGDRLQCFCLENDLIIANTYYEHPDRPLYTWKSPGDLARNQIDYILFRKRFRNSVKNCKTYPGADIGSDHNPLVCKMSVRLKRAMPANLNKKKEFTNFGKLTSPEFKDKHLIDVKNKYEILVNETGAQEEVASE